MGKIIYTQKNEKGDIHFVAGQVSYVQDGMGELKDRVVNIGLTLDVYNREKKENEKKYLSVAFWNNDDPSKAQLADRVRKAKLGAGSFIYLRVGTMKDMEPASDGTPRLACSGFDFQYNGQYEISVPDKDPYNVICGTCRRTQESGDYYQVNIPVERRSGGEKTTTWYSVSFKDSEKSKVGTRAKKVLKDGTPVCILTGVITDKEGNNGAVYHNAYAMDFVAGFANPKE